MTVYSYVVRYDVGFAPNPFHGLCSIATCKPVIRRGAAVGDWVIGVGSAEQHLRGHLVYATHVDETLSFDEYWHDARFANRRPNMHGSRKQVYGDNIYHRDPDTGDWLQENGRHSHPDGSPNPEHIRRDTGSDRVLLGREFVYFGGDGPKIPSELRSGDRDFLSNARGHRVIRDADHEADLVAWIRRLGTGDLGRPAGWPPQDRPRGRLSTRWRDKR